MTHIFSYFPHKSAILIWICQQHFYYWIFLLIFHYSVLFWETKFWHNLAEKYFIIWYSWFGFINLKEFIVDSINYLGWESNFSIRPPRVFKILSTQFQWTQTSERDLVERQHMQWFWATIQSQFLVNYLYVAGPNLGHLEGDLIITSLFDNYY